MQQNIKQYTSKQQAQKQFIRLGYVNCWTCGKKLTKPDKCSRCGITYYCSKECQTKDWPIHRKFTCRPEGKNLEIFQGKGVQQIDFMMNQFNRQNCTNNIAECVMKTCKKEKIQDIGLYCNICGDLDELGRFNGTIICKECHQIQLDM